MRDSNSFSYKKNIKIAFVLLLPALLIYTLFEIVPVLQSFYFSFFDWNGVVTTPLRYVGLENFAELFKNEFFYVALKNTLWFTLLNPIIQLSVALLLALLLSTNCRGYKFFKTVYFSPIILSATATGLMWYFILLPGTGVLSSLLNAIGLSSWDRNWLVDKGVAFNSVIVVNSWCWAGYYMIILYAAITSISQDVLEAAKIDGSTGFHRVRKIIIPMIWPVIIVTIVLQITGNLKAFDIIWVMTKGGPFYQNNVLTTLLYARMKEYNYGQANALSVIVFVISFVFTGISLKFMNRKDY